MAGGWIRDGGVQVQMDASSEDAVLLAMSRLLDDESSTHCEECVAVIPEACRKAILGVRLCVSCQSEHEKRQTTLHRFQSALQQRWPVEATSCFWFSNFI